MTTLYVKEGTILPEKMPFDEYRTPPELAAAAVKYFAEHIAGNQRFDKILDPSAGFTGIWGREAHLEYRMAELTGIDIQDFSNPSMWYEHWIPNQDFMAWGTEEKYDLILSNPPFKGAELFIEKCYGHLNGAGYMLFLLRLNFLASQKRQKLFSKCTLTDVIVSTQRISFYGGGTNATEYGIFVFRKIHRLSAAKPTLHFLTWR